jgi:hypothetical protein
MLALKRKPGGAFSTRCCAEPTVWTLGVVQSGHMVNDAMIKVRLPKWLAEAVAARSRAELRSFSAEVRLALLRHVEAPDDIAPENRPGRVDDRPLEAAERLG